MEAVAAVCGPAVAQQPQHWSRLLGGMQHAPKLQVLRDILAECGIGPSGAVEEDEAGANVAEAGEEGAADASGHSGHRVLVFCQLRQMLDLVASEVLGPHGISYLRIDGKMDPSERFRVVQRFNSDPSVDVLLLTTHVGGLGLNLTSADTVVFLEHDWNPMKDLQARVLKILLFPARPARHCS